MFEKWWKESNEKTNKRTWLRGAGLGSLVGLAESVGLPPQSVAVNRPKGVFTLDLCWGSQQVFFNRHRGGSSFSRGPEMPSLSFLNVAAWVEAGFMIGRFGNRFFIRRISILVFACCILGSKYKGQQKYSGYRWHKDGLLKYRIFEYLLGNNWTLQKGYKASWTVELSL